MACREEYTVYYSGSLSSDSGIVSSSRNGKVSFTWQVFYYPKYDIWVYNYNLSVSKNKIDSIAVEVSDNFDETDLIFSSPVGGTTYTPNMDIADFDPSNASFAGLPDQMYGLAVTSLNKYSYSFKIVTSKVPVWGDFFAKLKNPKTFIYNAGFGDPESGFDIYAVSDGSLNYHILRPDSIESRESVPEHNTLILIISGLTGLVLNRRFFVGIVKCKV